MKHPRLFKWTTAISRITCLLIVLSFFVWLYDLLQYLTLDETEYGYEAFTTEDAIALPLYLSAAFMLLFGVRLAFFAFFIFVVFAIVVDPSLSSFLACAIIGLLIFTPIAFLPKSPATMPNER